MTTSGLRLPLAFGRRVSAPLAGVVSVALAVLLAGSLAELTWLVIGSGEMTSTAGAGQLASAPAARGPASVPLAEMHLFGEAEPAADKVAAASAPDVESRLVLRGVVFTRSAGDARAIIGESTGPDLSYARGAELPLGAQLREIHPDRVLIAIDGRPGTLYLDPRPEQAVSEGDDSYQRLDNSADRTLARDLGRYQRQLQQNPQAVLGLVGMEPIRHQGVIEGYRLQPGPEGEFLASVGLEPGDILRGVNGIRLDSPTKGLDVLRELSVARRLSVAVRRGERDILLTYSVER